MRDKICLLIVLLVFSFFKRMPADQTPLWNEGISLIPYPQEVILGGEDFFFDDEVIIVLDVPASEADHIAAEDLAERLRNEWSINAVIGKAADGKRIVLTRQGADKNLKNQGYDLAVDNTSITIRAGSDPGIFYGTRTLMQIIQQGIAGTYVNGMKISDWPDIPIRAVHYDTKHHQDKMEYVKDFIKDLSDYKINMLIWEWEDKFAYTSHPEIGAPGAFTKEEMQELTRYARQYHIQIVPLVQGMGHVSYILKWPQNAHLREIPSSNWQFCPLKEGTYELLFDLWDEAIEATPGSEYLHIGSDETFELGQGVECGCRDRMENLGQHSFYMEFINRCARHVASRGRKHIAWTPPYRPDEKIRHPETGPVMAERMDLENAKIARRDGYSYWVYTPNPGIEHLFLPYFYRESKRHPGTTLENAYETLTTASLSGLYEGMVCASWDDSGLHNQVWVMRFINAAEYAWSGKNPTLDEFIDKYFKNYYGPEARDMRELFTLLNKGAYYYLDTFERKVWHWGLSGVYADGRDAYVGKTHLPDLPRDDAIEYDPFWNYEYKEMIERSRAELPKMQRALNICRNNLELGVKHSYDFEVFVSVVRLIDHTARTYLAISDLESTIGEAHSQHFISHNAAYQAFERAEEIIEGHLAEREEVFNDLVVTWEKSRLPKGLSTPGKKFFHQQDRARHQAFRRADMTYLICDEELLGLEDYLEKLRDYMAWYKETYL